MSNHVLVRNLALASLCLAPACIDGVGDPAELDATDAALASDPCPAGTPALLAPPPDQHLAFVLGATGVQRYSCNATATGPAWTFVAPVADLLDCDGDPIGTHYAGPTWEHEDGSTVVAAKVAGATVDPGSVPWLLLAATGHGGPSGKMTKVSFIQRLVTAGGNAPAAGCEATLLGATADVPYTTKYFFYRTRTRDMHRNKRCGATD